MADEIRRMRRITREEAEAWQALASQYGFVNEEGGFTLGCYVLEQEGGRLYVRLITPVPAGLYPEDLQGKTPPIRFDRTPTGEVILPERWWQALLERLSQEPGIPPDARWMAALAARRSGVSDTLAPASVETIAIRVPDEVGNFVTQEALPPGTRIAIQVTAEED